SAWLFKEDLGSEMALAILLDRCAHSKQERYSHHCPRSPAPDPTSPHIVPLGSGSPRHPPDVAGAQRGHTKKRKTRRSPCISSGGAGNRTKSDVRYGVYHKTRRKGLRNDGDATRSVLGYIPSRALRTAPYRRIPSNRGTIRGTAIESVDRSHSVMIHVA